MKSILVLVAFLGLATAHAEETTPVTQEAHKVGHDVKETTQKGSNRVKEAVCAEGDAKCAAKKVGHRVDETATKAKDKVSEIKDSANSTDKK